MLDISPQLQRSYGRAAVAFDHLRARTRLVDLAQVGSAKVMLPRISGDVPEVVLLNTSGGLTGGDRLDFTMSIGAGCHVLATTQTAERGYQSDADRPALVNIRAALGAGARLDWMPQETILYQDSHLNRHTEIDLAAGAACLLSESLILGRQAMGEVLLRTRLRDARIIRRDGRPVWADSFHLDADILADPTAALLGGARACAVICLVAQGAEDAAVSIRSALGDLGNCAAVSGWDGRCVVRIIAADGWPLRAQMAQVLTMLTGRDLPRVWQNAHSTQNGAAR